MNSPAVVTSTGFSPQGLLKQFKTLQGPNFERVLEMPIAPVYVSLASHSGIPVDFKIDATKRTAEDPTITPLLRAALMKVVADPKGEVNGESSSVTSMKLDPTTNQVDLVVRPTEFFMGRAVARHLSKEPEATDLNYLVRNSPHMLNVSLIVITEIAGQRYLLCQEKGKAIGSGAIHTLFAGNVSAKNLAQDNPLLAGLMTQAHEEIGLSLDPRNLKPVAFVSELGLGMLNVAYAAFTPDSERILGAFEAKTKVQLNKLRESGQLETRGIGFAPVNALLAIPLDGKGAVASGPVIMYRANDDGSLEILRYANRQIRPYWEAMSQLISKHPTLIDSWAERFELKTGNESNG